MASRGRVDPLRWEARLPCASAGTGFPWVVAEFTKYHYRSLFIDSSE